MKTGHTKEVKRESAAQQRAAYLERTVGEQLTIIQTRPGISQKELEKLQGWLKLQGVTKRSKIAEVLDLLHPKAE